MFAKLLRAQNLKDVVGKEVKQFDQTFPKNQKSLSKYTYAKITKT